MWIPDPGTPQPSLNRSILQLLRGLSARVETLEALNKAAAIWMGHHQKAVEGILDKLQQIEGGEQKTVSDTMPTCESIEEADREPHHLRPQVVRFSEHKKTATSVVAAAELTAIRKLMTENGQAGIIVTTDMAAAGRIELAAFNPACDDVYQVAAEIYRAMESVRRHTSPEN